MYICIYMNLHVCTNILMGCRVVRRRMARPASSRHPQVSSPPYKYVYMTK